MKKLLIFVLLLCLAAGYAGVERKKIEVDKCSDSGVYEVYKEITTLKKVSVVRDILHNVDWEKKKVNMARAADYQFIFQFVNPDIQARAIPYSIWISPDKDTLKIVEGDYQYVHLNKDDSNKLFESITETKLIDIEK